MTGLKVEATTGFQSCVGDPTDLIPLLIIKNECAIPRSLKAAFILIVFSSKHNFLIVSRDRRIPAMSPSLLPLISFANQLVPSESDARDINCVSCLAK